METSNLVCKLIVASPSIQTTNCPWKGHGHTTGIWRIHTHADTQRWHISR